MPVIDITGHGETAAEGYIGAVFGAVGIGDIGLIVRLLEAVDAVVAESDVIFIVVRGKIVPRSFDKLARIADLRLRFISLYFIKTVRVFQWIW